MTFYFTEKTELVSNHTFGVVVALALELMHPVPNCSEYPLRLALGHRSYLCPKCLGGCTSPFTYLANDPHLMTHWYKNMDVSCFSYFLTVFFPENSHWISHLHKNPHLVYFQGINPGKITTIMYQHLYSYTLYFILFLQNNSPHLYLKTFAENIFKLNMENILILKILHNEKRII